jgi:hypothetical protein
MLSQKKGISRWIMVVSCNLMLVLLLAACNLGGGATTAPTPAPTSPPVPTNPPTPSLITYTGAGFTIGYPQGWKVTNGNNRIVTFADPQGDIRLTITVIPNPNGIVSADNQVSASLQLFKSQSTNYRQINIASTTMIGGDTWSQGSGTGTFMAKGQKAITDAKVVVVADNHPATSLNTMAFTIAYVASQQSFDTANTMFFHPMLQSFKFL